MKYKGIELKEFKSDKPITFSPPRPMLVWDNIESTVPVRRDVLMYHPGYSFPVICVNNSYRCCAEPKPRRATSLELVKWLAQGNGQFTHVKAEGAWTELEIVKGDEGKPCNPNWRVRKWDDEEWHEPTVDYMGLEDLA